MKDKLANPLLTVIAIIICCIPNSATAYWPDSPIEELKSLDRLLASVDCLEGNFISVTNEVAHRLLMFEIIYEKPANTFNRFNLIRSRAKRLYEKIEWLNEPPEIYLPIDKGKHLLLELMGHHKRVVHDLSKFAKDFNLCAMKIRDDVPSKRLSEMYQRLGNYKISYKYLNDYYQNSAHHVGLLDNIRLAFLLSKTGNTEKANIIYQRIYDLYPRYKMSRIAAHVLTRNKCLLARTEERISKYLVSKHELHAVYTFYLHDFPNSCKIISSRLSSTNKNNVRHYLRALGDIRNKQAIPTLEFHLVNGSQREQLRSAESLVKIGELQYLPHYLQALKFEQSLEVEPHNPPIDIGDFILQRVPTGPKMSHDDGIDYTKVVKTWLDFCNRALKAGRPLIRSWFSNARSPYPKPIVPADSNWLKQVSEDIIDMNNKFELGLFHEKEI